MKPKRKRRHVLGVGFPVITTMESVDYVAISNDADYKSSVSMRVIIKDGKKYRLILEEI